MQIYKKINRIINSFLEKNPLKCPIEWQVVNCRRFSVYPDTEKDTVGMTQEISRYDREGREEPIHKIILATQGWREDEIIDTLGHELAHILLKEKEEEVCDWLGKKILKGQVKC